jgi:ribosomal protein L37AE/L43A
VGGRWERDALTGIASTTVAGPEDMQTSIGKVKNCPKCGKPMKRKLSTGELVCYGCKIDKLTRCARGVDGNL